MLINETTIYYEKKSVHKVEIECFAKSYKIWHNHKFKVL